MSGFFVSYGLLMVVVLWREVWMPPNTFRTETGRNFS